MVSMLIYNTFYTVSSSTNYQFHAINVFGVGITDITIDCVTKFGINGVTIRGIHHLHAYKSVGDEVMSCCLSLHPSVRLLHTGVVAKRLDGSRRGVGVTPLPTSCHPVAKSL